MKQAPVSQQAAQPVFALEGVSKAFKVGGRLGSWGAKNLLAVDDVTLSVSEGEALGIVGESGCGKSTLARLLLCLDKPTSGHMSFCGQDMSCLTGRSLRAFRRRVQAVLQDPYSSLNPRMSVREIIQEPMIALDVGTKTEREERTCTLMERVGLNPDFRQRYPHQFSGGQQQRVAIARALSVQPEVLVLDEPTSALDVSVRAQILSLLDDIREQFRLTTVFISHDLAVVEQVCNRVAVMYAGSVAEVGPATDVIVSAKHPYTKALTAAVPSPDPRQRLVFRELLAGEIPNPLNLPSGCKFHPRCAQAIDLCSGSLPKLRAIGGRDNRQVACHLFGSEHSVGSDQPSVPISNLATTPEGVVQNS